MSDLHRLTISDSGRMLAAATLRIQPETHSVHADLHIEAGHLPAGTRTRLVDAVLDEPVVDAGTHLEVTLPAGDGEILTRLRQRCEDLHTRLAGSSCLASGLIPLPGTPG